MTEWGYSGKYGPEHWPQYYPQAGGKRQSPVDIRTSNAQYNAKLEESPLQLTYDPRRTVKMTNNGHTFQVDVDPRGYNLSGGPLDENYQLVQFHMHWGSNDCKGSEHTINGDRYAAEIHLVHWNTGKFQTVDDALQYDRGIAVLGTFVKVGAANAGFEKLIPFLKKVKEPSTETPIAGEFDPGSLLPENKKVYWTYEGSLTTPPCYESVSFILFKEVLEVSEEQMETVRSLLTHCHEDDAQRDEGDGHCGEGGRRRGGGGRHGGDDGDHDGKDHDGKNCLVNNFRPTCPLNGRTVQASFKAY